MAILARELQNPMKLAFWGWTIFVFAVNAGDENNPLSVALLGKILIPLEIEINWTLEIFLFNQETLNIILLKVPSTYCY